MRLVERACLIQLTSIGARVLGDVIPVTEKGSFEALIVDEDDKGIWVVPREEEHAHEHTILVKLGYIATIQIMKESSSD